MALRRDANTLSSSERRELVNAILQLKADGIYDRFVLRHANANMMSIHRCPAFLPWHRRYLWDLEQEIQRVSGNPNLGIPYWNWPSGAESASMWNDDLLGGNGNTQGIVTRGPFRQGQWQVVDSSGNASGPLRRQLGQGTTRNLPTSAELEQLLRTTPFDSSPWNMRSEPSFRNRLEGWSSNSGPAYHNLGHVWVGGSMLPMTSPNDPVFFMHHCMVDKLWHEWQLRSPNQSYLPASGGPFGQNQNDPMSNTPAATIGSRPVDVLDSAAIGIEYDQLLPGTPSPTPTPEPLRGTPLTIDTGSITAQISRPGEHDLYRIIIPRFAEYVIETSGNSDTFMTLFGPNSLSNEVARNDDGGVNLNSRITLNLSAGMYYADIRLYSSAAIGEYAIRVTTSAAEENTIPQLTVGAPATAAAISVRNESDVYRFRVTRRAYHTIETTGPTDTYLSLFGPNDESVLIQEDDDSGSVYNSRIRSILNVGEYYARVRHYSSDATGAYLISVARR